jgi:hypothetical protein
VPRLTTTHLFIYLTCRTKHTSWVRGRFITSHVCAPERCTVRPRKSILRVFARASPRVHFAQPLLHVFLRKSFSPHLVSPYSSNKRTVSACTGTPLSLNRFAGQRFRPSPARRWDSSAAASSCKTVASFGGGRAICHGLGLSYSKVGTSSKHKYVRHEATYWRIVNRKSEPLTDQVHADVTVHASQSQTVIFLDRFDVHLDHGNRYFIQFMNILERKLFYFYFLNLPLCTLMAVGVRLS